MADPQLDRALPEAELPKLAPADHPVLGLGERGDRPVDTAWADFGSVVIPNSAQCLHGPILAIAWADFGFMAIPNSAQSLHHPILTSRR